jgi:hypothetical protein
MNAVCQGMSIGSAIAAPLLILSIGMAWVCVVVAAAYADKIHRGDKS